MTSIRRARCCARKPQPRPATFEKIQKIIHHIMGFLFCHADHPQPHACQSNTRQSIALIMVVIFEYLIDSVAQKLGKI